MRTMVFKGMAVLLMIALVQATVVPAVWAEGQPKSVEDPSQTTATGAGLQAASWLVTLPYGAAKCVVAILGGITGGFAYVFTAGDLDTAKKVWHTSVYGDYVITPDHLKGDKPVRFFSYSSEDGPPADNKK